MTHLVFDTETSGFPKAASAPLHHQPHIVQLAALLIDDSGEERSMNFIVRPDGWAIHAGAMEVHGITMEKAATAGVPKRAVMAAFTTLCRDADVVVAHNIEFDLKMVALEYRRLQQDNPLLTKRKICTMASTTDICKLPGQYGKYKRPKLIEAYRHFFGEDFGGAHDAMADVRACARIHQHISKQGLISQAI